MALSRRVADVERALDAYAAHVTRRASVLRACAERAAASGQPLLDAGAGAEDADADAARPNTRHAWFADVESARETLAVTAALAASAPKLEPVVALADQALADVERLLVHLEGLIVLKFGAGSNAGGGETAGGDAAASTLSPGAAPTEARTVLGAAPAPRTSRATPTTPPTPPRTARLGAPSLDLVDEPPTPERLNERQVRALLLMPRASAAVVQPPR